MTIELTTLSSNLGTVGAPASTTGRQHTNGHSLQEKRGAVFTKPLPISNKQILSTLGSAIRSEAAADITALRVTASIPSFGSVSGCSTALNSVPMQAIGYFSVMGVPAAALRMESALKKTNEARQIDDRAGMLLGVNEGISAASQATQGLSGVMSRTFSIEGLFKLQGPSQSLGTGTKLTGSIASVISYGFSLFGELISRGIFGLWGTSAFETEYRQMMSAGRSLEYLSDRYGLTIEDLPEKTDADLEKAGLSYLRPFARRNIELLKREGTLNDTRKLTDQRVDDFVKRYLGGNKAVRTIGAEQIMTKEKLKRQAEMKRHLGDKGFKAVLAAINNPQIRSEEVDKIVLQNIDITQTARNKRILLYTVGAIATALMFVFTGGIGAAVLASVMLGIYLVDAYMSHQKLEELRTTQDISPAAFDKVFPMAGIGIALTAIAFTTLCVILSIGSMGTFPLVVGLIGASLLLLQSAHHLDVINEKQEIYCKHLMKKEEVTLDEFAFLCQHMPKGKATDKAILEKINEGEKDRLQAFMELILTKGRDGMLKAVKLRKEQIETELAKALYSNSIVTA
jgi:hypothetical protein